MGRIGIDLFFSGIWFVFIFGVMLYKKICFSLIGIGL